MPAVKKIYFDHAAATPVDPVVLSAMKPYFSDKFGNAGSLHSFGQEAIAALDASRETVAAEIRADFQKIIFTGSATEANNLVLRGVVGRSPKPRIIISSIEHESVLETARSLEKTGVDVVYLSVDKTGSIDMKKLASYLNKDTVLVSVMYANNEVGTIQPIKEIAKIIDDFKKKNLTYPLFHTDAAQAFQFLDCDSGELGVDFMTLSSHKIYGPKGAGALYVKNSNLNPVITGGGQEFGLRAGTENIPAIVGFAKAVELVAKSRPVVGKKVEKLRDDLWRGIKKICPKAEMNGGRPCLPNILNVYFPGYDAQDLLTKFDLSGLAASSGSACRARASLTSYVIKELGYSKNRAKRSIRFSLGRTTQKDEITRALTVIKKALHSLK